MRMRRRTIKWSEKKEKDEERSFTWDEVIRRRMRRRRFTWDEDVEINEPEEGLPGMKMREG